MRADMRGDMRLVAVGKRYGIRRPWVVRGFSADLPAGRLVRVTGPNGSGKSTLLRVVAGVSRPSAGQVTGRPHCGYVPERFPGGLPFSGREYLLHLARVHGLRGDACGRAVDEWLDRLGAASYADQPVRSMSKGMGQKMALAQALLPSPGLLVLDEAWTGLDSAARGALDAAVTERTAAGGTVLFVDHDPARLAGLEDERWDFGSPGQVAVLAGPAPAAAVSVVPAAPRPQRVIIRLEAADAAAAVERVRAIDGVRVVSVDVDSVGVEGDGLSDVPGTQGPQADIGGPADADGPRGA